jgi:hypothetical protein
MDFFTITAEELNALDGLPYIQQTLYFRGIRPYMDRKTRTVGIKRRISYQSLCEALYIEPIAGVQTLGSPSHQQVRRAVNQLIQNGLIEVQPARRQLIFKCVLALRDKSVQNKAGIRPTDQADRRPADENPAVMGNFELRSIQADTPQPPQADTPHKDNNYLFFLREAFSSFWESYPQKQGRQNAWAVFQALSPDDLLMQKMLDALKAQIASVNKRKTLGLWVPNWKHPANWLTQHCWEDAIEPIEEKTHAKRQTPVTRKSPADIIWESCKDGANYDFEDECEDEPKNNVIAFKKR